MPWTTSLDEAQKTLERVWSCFLDTTTGQVTIRLDSYQNGRLLPFEMGRENRFEMTAPFGAVGLLEAVRAFLQLPSFVATPSDLIVTALRNGKMILQWRPNPYGDAVVPEKEQER